MLECKLLIEVPDLGAMTELIDTCWNVNYGCSGCAFERAEGINRYMLECK